MGNSCVVVLFLISGQWGLGGVKRQVLGKKERCLSITPKPLRRNPDETMKGTKRISRTTKTGVVEERASYQVRLRGDPPQFVSCRWSKGLLLNPSVRGKRERKNPSFLRIMQPKGNDSSGGHLKEHPLFLEGTI